jgi:AcrR family transcriptional regulator
MSSPAPARPRAAGRPGRGPGRPPGHDPRRPERLEQILEAACVAILDRGFPATRIADIAAAAGVSTGTVHYYFATKDEVLIAALKWASGRLFARIEERPADDSASARLARLLAVSVPYPGPARDEYVLWIELWLRVLHQPDLLAQCEAIAEQGRGYFHDAVRRGAERGELTPVAGPAEVAERIVAFVDGVGFETALGYRWTSPERMHERIVAFAAEQLGVAPAVLTDPGDRT